MSGTLIKRVFWKNSIIFRLYYFRIFRSISLISVVSFIWLDQVIDTFYSDTHCSYFVWNWGMLFIQPSVIIESYLLQNIILLYYTQILKNMSNWKWSPTVHDLEKLSVRQSNKIYLSKHCTIFTWLLINFCLFLIQKPFKWK